MLKLRELARDDIKEINKWRASKELISCLGAPYRYINEDVDYNWFEAYMKNRNTSVRCIICDSADEEKPLGLISLVNINNINRSAELHIMIGNKENQGKGIGTFAVNAIVNHAFNDLNLRRIELGVLETNARAISLYKKCGFTQEGIKRQSHYKDGKYVNMILMAILKEDMDKR